MKWEQAWLNYRKQDNESNQKYLKNLNVMGKGKQINRAIEEIQRAAKEMYGITVSLNNDKSDTAGLDLYIVNQKELGKEGYQITLEGERMKVLAQTENGILYGVFRLLAEMARGKYVSDLQETSVPANQLRMLNHWDNMDGSIERGYSGNSFFFENGDIIINERTKDYARLLASVGINRVVINNVNVKREAIDLITEHYFKQLIEMAQLFESYAIGLFVSVDFAAPVDIGKLNTADPLNEEVIQWWEEQTKKVMEQIPNFGGYLVKADSEGRPGPFTYGRTHADGANLLARALKPYGGIVIWRCFVYNCQQDWRDYKTDRARAGYDHFIGLDGTFLDNVILQIKNGPMDFQVREPVSPLFGGLENTNQMLEVQAAQEYTGQQIHVCYLIPMWKKVLDFHTYCGKEKDRVSDIVSGKTYSQINCGMTAVANTGDQENWTGHDLAAANFYGFGKLAWNPELTAEEIAKQWIELAFSSNQEVVKRILSILMQSWTTYEQYTAPLGIGWMVNPNHHYGPNVDGYEYDRWGTYHRADHIGIGVNRTENGTGYVNQYREPNTKLYNNPETCPMELLLFFHHLPYGFRLKNGKSILQHIYDTHFEGVEEVEQMAELWDGLKGYIAEKPYQRTKKRFALQKEHAKEWRDVINAYFYRKTMIPDQKGRTIY